MTTSVADQFTPFRWRFREIDIRAGVDADLPLMSVSLYKGVVPRSELMDSEGRAEDLSNYKVCEPGDIVLNRMSAYQGALGLSQVKGLVSPDYAVLRPESEWDGRYLVYLMKSQWFLGQIVMRLKGIGSIEQANVRTPRINIEDLGGILAPAPPIEEQRRIADFLDDQVGRIDQAIELRRGQRKLIEQQIRSLITKMVTGGEGDESGAPRRPPPMSLPLRRNRRRADRGREEDPRTPSRTPPMTQGTLLDITLPSGWAWEPLGYLAPRVSNAGRGDLEPLSVYLGAGVVRRADREDNHNVLGADLDKYLHVQPGDLVFNKLRTWQGGLGASRYEGVVSPAYYVLRSGPKIEPRFANYVLLSSPYLAELTRLSKFMPPSQFDMPWESLMRLPMLLPPIDEQRRIADFLDDQVARRHDAMAHLTTSIASFEERKRSLITAVVTGQLDVTAARPVGVGS